MIGDERLRQTHERLRNDLVFYARHCLRIKQKDGKIVPFQLNEAQQFIHQRIEDQRQRTGMVRVLILKGRQQGCSTYVAARFFHKAAWSQGQSVFILSHHSATTETLFQLVDRYRNLVPEQVRPSVTISNRRQLQFKNGSEYRVGTAGSGDIGRGSTNQYFHGSEVAFYENTDDIQTGVLQSVADVPGTEIILESTANGIGNFFHRSCMEALDQKGRFELIFVPWFWQQEYRQPPPPDFKRTIDEQQLKETYDLDDAQLYWRRLKILDLKSEWKFKQEYPNNVHEAFQTSGQSLILPMAVEMARKATPPAPGDNHAPIVIGVDPARRGDRTAIAIRQGRHLLSIHTYDDMDEMRLAGITANFIEQYQPQKVFIDVGLGYGTIDRLHELGYNRVVSGVHFGERAFQDIFRNRRAEMATELRDWLHEGGVKIPDNDELATDLLAVPDFIPTSSGVLALESKDKIRQSYGKSPDLFDAVALTFAMPVHNTSTLQKSPYRRTRTAQKQGSEFRIPHSANMHRQNRNTQDLSTAWYNTPYTTRTYTHNPLGRRYPTNGH